jgi:hypothetical protein
VTTSEIVDARAFLLRHDVAPRPSEHEARN